MAHEVTMPQLAQSVVEGELSRWLVKEGDVVKLDQPLAEIITDKVDVELPSPVAGTVLKIAVAEGQTVPVGTPLLYIGEKGESLDTGVVKAKAIYSALTSSIMGLEEKQEAAREMREVISAGPAVREGPVRAAPAVRKHAQELGVDLTRVIGTGPGGRITKEDVEKAAARAPAAAAERRVEYIPYAGRRKQVGARLFRAKQTIPHASCMEEIDLTDLVTLRSQQKAIAAGRGIQLTFLAYFVQAVVRALCEHPILNATLEEAEGRVALKKYYNIGIAVDTDEGLIVPVVRNADQKSLLEIAAEIHLLATKARENRLELADVQDSTFTISSVGGEAGLFSVAIINSPEVALLNLHRIEERPAVVKGQIVIRHRMYVTLTFDHRVLDGGVATRFLRDFKREIDNVAVWAKI